MYQCVPLAGRTRSLYVLAESRCHFGITVLQFTQPMSTQLTERSCRISYVFPSIADQSASLEAALLYFSTYSQSQDRFTGIVSRSWPSVSSCSHSHARPGESSLFPLKKSCKIRGTLFACENNCSDTYYEITVSFFFLHKYRHYVCVCVYSACVYAMGLIY